MNRLLIVDGHNLLFQMFYGMPSRILNSQGRAIHGTIGFVGAMLKMIRRVEPTHVVVLFDGENENPRCELAPDYKANREDYSLMAEEDVPFSQLPDIYSALDYLGIKYFETVSCETDDLIASYSIRYGAENEIVISSFDSDFFQLITEKVSILRYRGDNTVICTPEYIRQKFGIEPRLYADFKSLTGDSADNIKGAEKVGPKTAAQLVNEFGMLESIIANAENIKKASVRDSIVKSADRLRLNYELIKLCDREEVPFTLDELKYAYTGITTGAVLDGIGIR